MTVTATRVRTLEQKHTRAGVITAREIEAATSAAIAAQSDVWLTDPGARGQGRFTIRCTASGARVCMFRHTRTDGTREIVKVADYDPRGVRGMTLHEAREKAGELAKLATGGDDLRELFAARAAAKAAAAEALVVAQRKAAGGTFEALFRVYVGTLRGRMSHDDARSIFRLHVSLPFPELAAKPATKVRAEELRDVLARLIDAGKGRTAAKLRAYVRAAFSMAMRASLDPTLPQALTAFNVEANPADRLPSLAQFSRALDRALTLPELKSFWNRLLRSPDCAAQTRFSPACCWAVSDRRNCSERRRRMSTSAAQRSRCSTSRAAIDTPIRGAMYYPSTASWCRSSKGGLGSFRTTIRPCSAQEVASH